MKAMIGALLAVGAIERILVTVLKDQFHAAGEATRVAEGIAAGDGFAGAFMAGEPTAHLLPTTPVLAGAVYALFGTHGLISESLLLVWAIGLALATYLILFSAFGKLGAPLTARLVALGFLCLAPSYFHQETMDFRTWEGGLTAFLSALFLRQLLCLREIEQISYRTIIRMSALAALIFFCNPTFGIGTYVAACFFCLIRLRGRKLAAAFVAAPLALALIVVPWGIRNSVVMGAFIPLRDNAGLELASAQYDGALGPTDPLQRRLNRLTEIHPSFPDGYRAMVAAGGEVAYSRKLGEEARAWMSDHPEEVARLVLLHIRQIVSPPPWIFEIWGSRNGPIRSVLTTLTGILGLAGFVTALARRRPGWIYPVLMVVPPILAFSLFQPMPRYTYLFYALFAYGATGLVWLIVRHRSLDRIADGRPRPAEPSARPAAESQA